ncbi:hypothetical protein MMC14_007653 [Varicellaria rhodocarpa]|nr:hypothetical protein [Varicellaria rhodocarpa]
MSAQKATDPYAQTFCPTYHSDTYPFIAASDVMGKNVFITGASKGIGRATSLAYAKAGASKIGLSARSSLTSLADEIAAVAKEAGHPAPTVTCCEMDVTERDSIEAAAKEIDNAFDGRLDVLLNNAGYLEVSMPVAESDPDEWWKAWTVNVRGPYLMTRAFLPLMLKGGDKTIINVSSLGAHSKRPGASGYQTSKMAICRFTEFLMVEYQDQGLLSFSIHPGGVMTELARALPKCSHRFLVDKAEMAADTIVWLTQEKRDWLAGRYVSCNWDMQELLERKDDIVARDLLKFRMSF